MNEVLRGRRGVLSPLESLRPAPAARKTREPFMRSTTLPMDAFGKEAVESYAEDHRLSPSDVVGDAALFYLADRHSGRTAWHVPRFARQEELGTDGELEIALDDEIWAAVEHEAARQGVPVALLLRHAVMYFLAGSE
jgi:hypothetical protein